MNISYKKNKEYVACYQFSVLKQPHTHTLTPNGHRPRHLVETSYLHPILQVERHQASGRYRITNCQLACEQHHPGRATNIVTSALFPSGDRTLLVPSIPLSLPFISL